MHLIHKKAEWLAEPTIASGSSNKSHNKGRERGENLQPDSKMLGYDVQLSLQLFIVQFNNSEV